jgi:hypothetical protein
LPGRARQLAATRCSALADSSPCCTKVPIRLHAASSASPGLGSQVSADRRWIVRHCCRSVAMGKGHHHCLQRLPCLPFLFLCAKSHGRSAKPYANINLCWAQTMANTIGLRFAIALAQARRRSLLIRCYGACLAGESPLVRGTNHPWDQPFVRP